MTQKHSTENSLNQKQDKINGNVHNPDGNLQYDDYNKKDFIVSSSLTIINEKLGKSLKENLHANSRFISPNGGDAGDVRYNNNYTKFAFSIIVWTFL